MFRVAGRRQPLPALRRFLGEEPDTGPMPERRTMWSQEAWEPRLRASGAEDRNSDRERASNLGFGDLERRN